MYQKYSFHPQWKTYIQIDGITMGSPLAYLLFNIFIIELKRPLFPNISTIKFWRRYVDNTNWFVKVGLTEYMISVLNKT